MCALVGIARVDAFFSFQVRLAGVPRSKFGLVGASARSTCRGHVCARVGLRAWMRFFRSKFGLRSICVSSSAFMEQAHAARAGGTCAPWWGLRACGGGFSFQVRLAGGPALIGASFLL